MMSDIEDFTTKQLAREILRREEYALYGQCWYCKQNIFVHTCKYSETEKIEGWLVDPAISYFDHWRCVALKTGTNDTVVGVGSTRLQATFDCITQIKELT